MRTSRFLTKEQAEKNPKLDWIMRQLEEEFTEKAARGEFFSEVSVDLRYKDEIVAILDKAGFAVECYLSDFSVSFVTLRIGW